MTCRKAIGVADAMKKKFGEKLGISIFTTDSEEAKAYELKTSTTVFVNQEQIPLDVATSAEKMENFLNTSIQ
jgi:hypothetical protein